MVLLQFREHAPGTGDVALLGGFVTTTQQHNHNLPAWREIDAISRASENAQFVQSATQALAVTQIAKPDRFQARQDPGRTIRIPKPSQPLVKYRSSLELVHWQSVSERIQ
jgi:hypothetical protein